MTKKIVSLLLAAIMLVSVTACTTDAQPQGGTGSSGTSSTEASGTATSSTEASSTDLSGTDLSTTETSTTGTSVTDGSATEPSGTKTNTTKTTKTTKATKTTKTTKATSTTISHVKLSTFDIIGGIDKASIKKDGKKTYFNSVTSNGKVIRFVGENITVSVGSIKFAPDSYLASLDSVGVIHNYTFLFSNIEKKETWVDFSGGYTFSDKTAVSSTDELIYSTRTGIEANPSKPEGMCSLDKKSPNFIRVENSKNSKGSCVFDRLGVEVDASCYTTGIKEILFYTNFFPTYMEGDTYNPAYEQRADLSQNILDFYLIVVPDVEGADSVDNSNSIYFLNNDQYRVGNLKDKNGKVLNKKNAKVYTGTTLEVTVGSHTFDVELPVVKNYRGAETMNDLVPYAYPSALGDLNTLVVPVIWADQKNMAKDSTLQLFRKGIGRVVDKNGKVVDYSDKSDNKLSLSEYYDMASYGKLTINSFITDWYYSKNKFADNWQKAPDIQYADEVVAWVRKTYPKLDWKKYDRDGNGYIDSLIILNAGVSPDPDTVYIISYGGAINFRQSYIGDRAGTASKPNANVFTNVGYSWIQNDYSTIIHEFAHGLGLVDYYDVTYSGIDAVGRFDMQSQSVGDWNAYSKYSVGWMDPTIVKGLSSGQSVEYTIGSSALTDDVIIIPAAGQTIDGPFSEYVMIDLLTDDGVNAYYADGFGLAGVNGVRISHVNANMEKRTLKDPATSKTYDIGTIHYTNAGKGDLNGKYLIEVIQKGGDNTFTDPKNLNANLRADHLFYTGDTFDAESYSEFFVDGKMDDGSPFGYEVKIVAMGKDASGNPTATVKITRK